MKRNGFLIRFVVLSIVMLAVLPVAAGTAAAMGMMDRTPPVIANILPAGTVGGSSANVSATYSDSGMMASGIDAATAAITVSGASISGCVADTAHISCTASGLAEGSHTISVSVKDKAGNLGTGTGTFTVTNPGGGGGGADTTPPAITNILPAGTVSATTTMVSADYSDGGSGINTATASLTVSGATLSGCTAGAANITCTASGLAEGQHDIGVSVSDNAGNTASASGTFTVSTSGGGPDTMPPVVTNIQPSGTIYTTSVTISADYSDPAPSSGIDPSSAMIHLDGRMLFTGCVATETHVSCPKSGLSTGTHKIEIYIGDNAGNMKLATGTFTVSGSTCVPARPSLGIAAHHAFWAGYSDYLAHELSLSLNVTNNGTGTAYDVALTGSNASGGVTLISAVPVSLGNLGSGTSAGTVVRYHVPAGIAQFDAGFTGSASDACGTGYTYPV